MKFLTNITRITSKWSDKDLEIIKNALFIVIVIDIFGIYWYLKLFKLGYALLIVSLGCLGYILYLERGKKHNKMEIDENNDEEEEETEEKEEKKEKEEKEDNGFEFGLPSPKEYQKRMDKAFDMGI